MCPDGIGGRASGSQRDFDSAVEAFRQAQVPYLKGDPKPMMELLSRSDDVTLLNPLGPPRRGPAEVDKAGAEAAAQLQPPSFVTAPYVVTRRCLDTALLTLAISFRFSGSRRGWPVAKT
jgi:hypothetical protein